MHYKGFISYSHTADLLYAPALQSALHRFAKPFYRLRALRIFRDQTDLSTNPALWPVIQKALDESEYFLLLASPSAAKSKWVKREINHWLVRHQGSLEKLLIIWTEGNLVWDEERNDFDWTRTDAIPKVLDWNNTDASATSLQGKFNEQPFYLDQRWVKSEDDLSLRNPRFLDQTATLAATLHGKSKADMIGDDVYEHKKYKYARTIAGAVLLIFAIFAGGFGVYANQQRKQAVIALQEAEKQRRIAVEQTSIAEAQTIEAKHQADLQAQARADAEKQTEIAKQQKLEAVKQQTRAEQQTVIAERERNVALSRQFAATARSELGANPAESVRLAKEGLQKAHTSQAEAALRLSLAESHVRLVFNRHKEIVRAVYSADGKLVAVGYVDGVADIWDANTGERKLELAGHVKAITDVAFSPDGKSLVTASEDKTAIIWSVETGGSVTTLKGHANGLARIAFSPDNKVVVTSSSESSRVWDARAGKLINVLAGRCSGTFGLSFSQDSTLLTAGKCVWETKNWTVLKSLDPELELRR